MFNRILLIAVFSLVLILPVWAAESGPSNTVGFISFNCAPGAWMPFAFPFSYYTAGHVATNAINSIMVGGFTGGTPATGDRIWDQNTMSYIYLNTAGNWVGAWTNITPGHAYWVRVYPTHPAVTAATAGEVDMTPLTIGTMQAGMFNPVGLRDPGVVPLQNTNLTQSGFTGGTPATSDRIWDQNTLSYSYYNPITQTWMGALVGGLQPGHALWIQVKSNHNSFTWIYIPLGAPNPGLDNFGSNPVITPAVNPSKVLRQVGE